MRSAVLFDLDGTLIDSSPLHTRAFSEAVQEAWKPCDVPTRTDLTTQQKMDLIGIPDELREKVQRTTRAKTMDLIPLMVRPDERLISEIRALAKDTIIGVVTNARREPSEAMLWAMGLYTMVSVLVTSEDGKHKPAPDLYRVARDRIISPRFLAVEDSDIGIESALAAGLSVLRVSSPKDITCERIARAFIVVTPSTPSILEYAWTP